MHQRYVVIPFHPSQNGYDQGYKKNEVFIAMLGKWILFIVYWNVINGTQSGDSLMYENGTTMPPSCPIPGHTMKGIKDSLL